VDFLELAESRYSVRSYKSSHVSDDVINAVLSAAVLAPTACNRQPFRILVLPTHGHEQDLLRIYSHAWFVQAPLVIAFVGVLSESWTRRDGVNYTFVDVAIAMDHLILAATEKGLGTCWVAAFNASAAREVLGLPNGVEPVAFTPLGYPGDSPGPKERRAVEQLVKWGRW
jgi:nitroreductase